VHRDIKPENILLEEIPVQKYLPGEKRPQFFKDKKEEGRFVPGLGGGGIGRVKLADFGLSKIVWNANTKTPCGTMGYTAPEVVKDMRYSKSVDMWALGCVLYTMLCGFPPFYHENVAMLTEKVSRGDFEFLSPWWDDISAEAKDLIASLLCVDPNRRLTIQQFFMHPWIKQAHIERDQWDQRAAKNSDTASVDVAKVSVESCRNSDKSAQSSLDYDNSMSTQALKAALDMTYSYQRRQDDRWGFLRNKLGLNGKLVSLFSRRKAASPYSGSKLSRRISVASTASDSASDHNSEKCDNHVPSFASTHLASAFELSMDGASILQRRHQVKQSI